MLRLSLLLLFVSALLAGGRAFAEPGKKHELGSPIIRNYAIGEFAEDAEGELSQVWSATSDARGVMYFGLWRNIIQFDGQKWNLIPVPSGPVYGLTSALDGTIYVAMVGDFGYLAGDEKGKFSFVSLLPKLPKSQAKPTTVWSVHATSHGVYFESSQTVYRYHRGALSVIREDYAYKGYAVHDTVYLVSQHGQIAVIRDGEVRRVPYFERFGEHDSLSRPVVLPWLDQKALIVTNRGMYLHDLRALWSDAQQVNADGSDPSVMLFATEADAYVTRNQAYCGKRLADNRYAIGTRTGGVVIIDERGRLLQVINHRRGLIDDFVLDLYADGFDNLWATTNSGIAHIATSSPTTVFDENNGIDTTVLFVKRHRDTVYFSTFKGFYFLGPHQLSLENDEHRVGQVADSQAQSFRMFEHRGALLGAHDNDLVQIDGSSKRRLITVPDTILTLETTHRFPDHIFAGLGLGISVLKASATEAASGGAPKVEAELIENERLASLPSAFYELVSAQDGDLWASSEDKGIYQIRWFGAAIHEFEIFHYGLEDGLPALTDNNVYRVKGELLIGTKSGVYKVEPKREAEKGEKPARIVPEQQLNALLGEPAPIIWHIQTDSTGALWLSNQDKIGVIRRAGDGSYTWDTRIMSTLAGKVITFATDKSGVIWIGSDKALYRYDSTRSVDAGRSFVALVRQVTTGSGRVLHDGDYFEPPRKQGSPLLSVALEQTPRSEPTLAYQDNTISFRFSAAFYEKPEDSRFQYQLEGFDDHPSAWVKTTTKEYTNLPEGAYTFHVIAKNTYGHESKRATYRFVILPPWYRTWWAYLLGALGSLAVLASILQLYTQKLRSQKAALEALVQERTLQLKEAALTDPLTGLRNRRFMTEILQDDVKAFINHKHHLLRAGTNNRRGEASEDSVYGVFLLDIDHFKKINDTYKHEAGDRVLRQLSEILRGLVRGDDVVIRLGGEEFLVVLKKTSPDYLHVFADRILNKVREHAFDLGGGSTIRRTCSIGYTYYPLYSDKLELLSFEQSIQLADMGLYYAKSHGRDQGIFIKHGAAMPQEDTEVRHMVTDVEYAMRRDFVRVSKLPPPNHEG